MSTPWNYSWDGQNCVRMRRGLGTAPESLGVVTHPFNSREARVGRSLCVPSQPRVEGKGRPSAFSPLWVPGTHTQSTLIYMQTNTHKIKYLLKSWVCWSTSSVWALRRQERVKLCESGASPVSIVSSRCPRSAEWGPISTTKALKGNGEVVRFMYMYLHALLLPVLFCRKCSGSYCHGAPARWAIFDGDRCSRWQRRRRACPGSDSQILRHWRVSRHQ